MRSQRGKISPSLSCSALGTLLIASCLQPHASAQLDLGNLQEIGSGWSSPIYADTPPGDNTRLFVVQQGGLIRLVVNGTVQATNFLNVSSLLTPSSGTVTNPVNASGSTVNGTFTISRGGEQGLLGLAFAPDYQTSGVFYINYVAARNVWSVNTQSGTAIDLGRTVVARYTRSAANPNVADPNGQIIFTADQPFTNHNGGCIHFDGNGLLFIGMGDGGSANDPGNRALDPNNIHGKLLRIDPSGDDFPADPNRNYRIPPGNPYAAGGGAPEIWARGLRNPWRWSFDALTGDLWIADVGQDVQEEINFVPGNGGPARNYGWRIREGTRNTGLSAGAFDVSNLTAPVYTYLHGAGALEGFSVTGGYVYRGHAIPAWRGRYFFADYVNRNVWSARMVNGVWTDFMHHTDQLNNLGTTTTLRIQNVSSFGEDNTGELYIVQHNGRIRKIVPDQVACVADVDNGSGLGHPDGGVTIEDLLFYLQLFDSGDIRADVDNGSGMGIHDDGVTIDDLLFFLFRFESGC